VVLFALMASGCTTDDGLDYDVPARSEVRGAQMEFDSDGTPVVLAQINLNYGTRGQRKQWEPKYRAVNVQTVLFARRDGAWKRHAFRNLQQEYSAGSFLVRNREGRVQPMVWNRDRISLYSRSGDDWLARSTTVIGDGTYLQGFSYGNYGLSGTPSFRTLLILGDSVWQTMGQDDKNIYLVSSTGERILLDSNSNAGPEAFYYGIKENHLIATRTRSNYNTYPPEPYSSQVVCYSWTPGAADPHVRKRILLDSSQSVPHWNLDIRGEFHIAIGMQGMVHSEMILRGDDIIRVEDVAPVDYPNDPIDTAGITSDYALTATQTGPDGCLHRLYRPQSRDSGFGTGRPPTPIPFLLHTSTCKMGVDTLPLPGPVRTSFMNSGLPAFHFSEDGSFVFLMLGTTPYFWTGSPYEDNEIGPSGIYLARWAGPGKWAVDTIAEY
jgi:hypothetical protein